mmetsp:Transcript_4007/g.4637  ORF Transcript_4007/g.4637 Transcript_4007/m.4637 type:complete len:80 (-) Transcript_4007:503-742(-)
MLYVLSSDYTLVSHSILIANTGGILIVALNLIRAIPVHKLEIYGTIIVVVFVLLFINDGSSTKTNGETNILKGDLIAMG